MLEKQKSNSWLMFLIIGMLIGSILGYYAASKGWLGQGAVGKSPNYFTCQSACAQLGAPGDVGCQSGCQCISSGGSYSDCWFSK